DPVLFERFTDFEANERTWMNFILTNFDAFYTTMTWTGSAPYRISQPLNGASKSVGIGEDHPVYGQSLPRKIARGAVRAFLTGRRRALLADLIACPGCHGEVQRVGPQSLKCSGCG